MKFLIDNLFLVVTALVSGTMLLWSSMAKRQNDSSVTTLQATQLINRNNAVVVDVRDADAFAQGRLIKALHAPIADLEAKAAGLVKKKETPVIVVCQTGQRAQRAQSLLKKAGYSAVYCLHGGMNAWREAGLPVEK